MEVTTTSRTAHPPRVSDDHALAIEIADSAGSLLAAMHQTPALSGKELGAAGDEAAHQLIVRMLRQHRPDDGVLSEESAPDSARLAKRRVWIVDPLDGTREYGERRSDWAVHIALVIDGLPQACAVGLPALGMTLATAALPPLPPAPAGRMKILVSRTRAPAVAEKAARLLDAELVPMGSAGAKAMAVLRGEAHAYLHAGGQYEWDSCAPVGVALAAGLHASRIDGSPCIYNRPEVAMPDLLVCRPECAAVILAAIRSCA